MHWLTLLLRQVGLPPGSLAVTCRALNVVNIYPIVSIATSQAIENQGTRQRDPYNLSFIKIFIF